MIPLLIGAGIAGILGAGGMAVAKDTQREAEETLNQARTIYDDAKMSLESQQRSTETSLKNLGDAKYRVLTDLIPQFIISFNKFKNVSFTNSVGINELDNLKLEQFSSADFASLKQLADTSEGLKKGAVAGGAAGAAIALGAGALTVDAVLGAGTVASVASIAGVGAAADLALAGIGGLVPGLAVVAGPALLIGGFASFYKADENLEKAKSALAQSEEAAEEMDNAEYLCRQIERRSDMFNDVLDRLVPLLRRSVQELNRISNVTFEAKIVKKRGAIAQFFASLFNIQLKDRIVTKKMKKNDYNNLNDSEKTFLAMSGAIAKAVKAVIDTPILDSYGNVTDESEEVADEMDDKIPDYEQKQQFLLSRLS